MATTLNYIFDLPGSFKPKAEYALATMLRPYGVRPVEVDAPTLRRQGGFFYGLSLPEWERPPEAPIFAMISRPETWAYFTGEEAYGEPDLDNLPCLEELPDTESEAKALLKDVRSQLKKWMALVGRSPALFQIPGRFPLLFGRPLAELDEAARTKYSEADLLASAFFLLSDWPQTYIGQEQRDAHGRIPYARSIQGKLGMGEFPLVDLYGELLAHWLGWTGLQAGKRSWSGHSHGLAITMDIDNLRKHPLGLMWRESRKLFRKAPDPPEYALSARSKPRRYAKALRQSAAFRNPLKSSVLAALDRFAERGYPCTLFLKAPVRQDPRDARDYLKLRFVDKLMERLRQLGAEAGYHSSYQAGYAPELFEKEHARLAGRLGRDVPLHRAHYLRYDPENATELLERQGVRVDSSLGWADYIGYRASTTHPHRIFDRKANRTSEVWELPMNMMDAQLMRYMNLTVEEALAHTELQLLLASRFGGVTVWNFHHHIYDELDAPGWSGLFEGALDMIPRYQPHVGSLSELADGLEI